MSGSKTASHRDPGALPAHPAGTPAPGPHFAMRNHGNAPRGVRDGRPC